MADTLVNKFASQGSANTATNITDSIGADERLTILSVSICNTATANDLHFKLWVDPASGDDAYIYDTQPLPAKSTFIHNTKIVLLEGDVLKFAPTDHQVANVIVSALKQTAQSASEENLSRTLLVSANAASDALMTPNNTTAVKTILWFTICNTDASDATTFDVQVRNSGGTEFYLYQDQALPSRSTFEHSDKIVLVANEELVFTGGASSLPTSVICSYLLQP